MQDQITYNLFVNTTGNSNFTNDLTNVPTYAFVTAEDLFGVETLRSLPSYAETSRDTPQGLQPKVMAPLLCLQRNDD
jgi:hypothetical protein